MTTPWQPFREPLRATLARTVAIPAVVGVVLAADTGFQPVLAAPNDKLPSLLSNAPA